MTTRITGLTISGSEIKIDYSKGEKQRMIMSYYGQWATYGGKYPVPTDDLTKYDKITHLVYGFMGFNNKGEIGSWDIGADLGKYAQKNTLSFQYDTDFYKNLYYKSTDVEGGLATYNGTTISIAYPQTNIRYNDGTSNISNYQFFNMAYVKYKKPNLKIMMSFGGWQYGSAGPDATWDDLQPPAQVFDIIAGDSDKLAKFTKSIHNLITNYKFQMIQDDKNNYYPIVYSTPDPDDPSKAKTNPYLDSKYWTDNKNSNYTLKGKPYSLFDGVDIDWEYPTGCDSCAGCVDGTLTKGYCPRGWTSSNPTKSIDNYGTLLSTFKNLLPNNVVTTTNPGDYRTIDKLCKSSKVNEAFNKIDAVSIMSYDFMNGNNFLTHDSPLYNQKIGSTDWNTDTAVKIFENHNIPLSKINIGIPFYGRFQYITKSTFDHIVTDKSNITQEQTNLLFSGSTAALYSTCKQNVGQVPCNWVSNGTTNINSINYQMVANTSIATCGASSDIGCDFTLINEQFIEVNDTNVGSTYYISKESVTDPNGDISYIILSMPSTYSIQEKTKYIKDNDLNGVITWMMSQDVNSTLAKLVHDNLK